MTSLHTAAGRVAHSLVLVAGAVGFSAAIITLVTAASSVAMAWPQVPVGPGCSLFMCVGEAINNALGIPGSVVGAVAVVVVVAIVVGSGVPTVPEFYGVNTSPTGPGDDVTTYIPGVSPLPNPGDLIYVPGLGASKVTKTIYNPNSVGTGGTEPYLTVETELGTIIVETHIVGP